MNVSARDTVARDSTETISAPRAEKTAGRVALCQQNPVSHELAGNFSPRRAAGWVRGRLITFLSWVRFPGFATNSYKTQNAIAGRHERPEVITPSVQTAAPHLLFPRHSDKSSGEPFPTGMGCCKYHRQMIAETAGGSVFQCGRETADSALGNVVGISVSRRGGLNETGHTPCDNTRQTGAAIALGSTPSRTANFAYA